MNHERLFVRKRKYKIYDNSVHFQFHYPNIIILIHADNSGTSLIDKIFICSRSGNPRFSELRSASGNR